MVILKRAETISKRKGILFANPALRTMNEIGLLRHFTPILGILNVTCYTGIFFFKNAKNILSKTQKFRVRCEMKKL